ncbi:MAG TPA: M48 family metallopeptidase [Candidatus Binatia bacterium]|nr:M48 family metallopeptidase [Candidatus Binatia bacterium]
MRFTDVKTAIAGATIVVLACLAGCAVSSSPSEPQAPDIRQVSPQQAQRIYRVMAPLLRAMDKPRGPKDIYIGIMDDPQINAANAGAGQFYVTTGLLQKASDDQLRGILAHEIAHDDLGHVAKLQTLGAGLGLGIVLLEQLLPGSSAVTPIAGSLIARGYSRTEEYAADRHGVTILNRAGYKKDVLINALNWVSRASGGNGGAGGGFLSTHPATDDRIEELKRLA